MNKAQKKNLIIIGILVLVLVIILYFVFKGHGSGFGASSITTPFTPNATNWANTFSKDKPFITYGSSALTLSGGTPSATPLASTELFLMYDPGWVQPIPPTTANVNGQQTTTPANGTFRNALTATVGGTTTTSYAYSNTNYDTVCPTFTPSGSTTAVDISNIVGGGNNGVLTSTSIMSNSNLTPVIGWAYSANSPQTGYYYSATCLSAIPNKYKYLSANVSDDNTKKTDALITSSGYYTPYTGGPGGTAGEYGAFNAYFQYDTNAAAFMNNDTQYSPFQLASTVTSATIAPYTIENTLQTTALNNLKNVKTYYTSTVFFTWSGVPTTVSYSQIMGIPADAIWNDSIDINYKTNFPGTVPQPQTALTTGTYSGVTGGITGGAMQSKSNNIVSDSQWYRQLLLLGVLTAMHSMMLAKHTKDGAKYSIASGTLPTTLPFSYQSDILADLSTNYQGNKLSTLNGEKVFISYNTSHAIYLTLMARDSWISNQLFYIKYL